MKSRSLQFLSPLVLAVAFLCLLVLALSNVSGIGGPVKLAFATGTFPYNFESTLSPWQGKADPFVTSWSFTRESANVCPFGGDWAAVPALQSSPSSRSGVWMYTSYSDSGSVSVSIDWRARRLNDHGCDDPNSPCAAIAYVGTSNPTYSSEFAWIADMPTSGEDWLPYHYETSAGPTGTLYIAIGWRTPYGDEEEEMSGTVVQIDCVLVDIEANSSP